MHSERRTRDPVTTPGKPRDERREEKQKGERGNDIREDVVQTGRHFHPTHRSECLPLLEGSQRPTHVKRRGAEWM